MAWVAPAASLAGSLLGGKKGSTSSASSVSVQEVSQGWDFGNWTVSTGGGDANATLSTEKIIVGMIVVGVALIVAAKMRRKKSKGAASG